MSVRLFLSHIDDRYWKGMVDVDGETWKVTLFPGSSTKPWSAVLESGGWVELTPDSPIIVAIQIALDEWQTQPIHPSPLINKIKDISPDVLEKILTLLKEETNGNMERV